MPYQYQYQEVIYVSNIPNQYHLYIKKPEKYDTAFYIGNRENTNEAFRVLSKSGFGLYMWLLENQANYDFDLFSTKVQKDLGFCARTYDNAVAELKKNNYLVYQGKEGVNLIYYFYDKPYLP